MEETGHRLGKEAQEAFPKRMEKEMTQAENKRKPGPKAGPVLMSEDDLMTLEMARKEECLSTIEAFEGLQNREELEREKTARDYQGTPRTTYHDSEWDPMREDTWNAVGGYRDEEGEEEKAGKGDEAQRDIHIKKDTEDGKRQRGQQPRDEPRRADKEDEESINSMKEDTEGGNNRNNQRPRGTYGAELQSNYGGIKDPTLLRTLTEENLRIHERQTQRQGADGVQT